MATACQCEMQEMANTSVEVKAVAISSTTPVSCATLQGLPNEILDYILMKVVVKEVMEKKLAKSAWIDYAVRVIKPLRMVSSHWNYRLATNWFKVVLSRNIMRKDPLPISIEEIARGSHCFGFGKFGILNNQIYNIHSYGDACEDTRLRVYDGRDLSRHIKEIPLPSIKNFCSEDGMAVCKRSNSFYIWQSSGNKHATWPYDSDIWHLMPNGDGGFEVLLWPTYPPQDHHSWDLCTASKISVYNISSLDDGNLLVLRIVYHSDYVVAYSILSIHRPNGLVIRNVRLSFAASLSNVAMKSNGNFVFAQQYGSGCIIRETDKDGNTLRTFHYSRNVLDFEVECVQRLFLDACDRVIFLDGFIKCLFLDCELNFLAEVEFIKMNPRSEPDNDDDYYDYYDEFILVQADFDKYTNEMVVGYWGSQVLFLNLTV